MGNSKEVASLLWWENYKKGHFALKDNPPMTRLRENKKPIRKFTKEYLESLAQVKIAEKIVKSRGPVFIYKGMIYPDERLVEKIVEL